MGRFSSFPGPLAILKLTYHFAFCALMALASILSFPQLELDSLASDCCITTSDELKRKWNHELRKCETSALVAMSLLLTQKTSGKAIGLPNYQKH